MRPMLATPAAAVPDGDGWSHEVKWDGMRVLVRASAAGLRLFSRTERDVTIAFPELQRVRDRLAEQDLLLDGELVVLRDGVPSFAALAERFNVTNERVAQELAAAAPVTLMAFDVLQILGRPTVSMPLRDRRALLEAAELDSAVINVPPTFDDGAALLTATAESGLEGVVSKRLSSTYQAGRRSEDWRKIVHRRTASFVIGGWRPETDRAHRLGAVLLGAPTPDGLSFRGRIGSGLAGKAGEALRTTLAAHGIESSPFSDEVPAIDARGAHWVEPAIVADVEFLGFTGTRLRQPSWRGIRHDLTPDDLLLPDAAAGRPSG